MTPSEFMNAIEYAEVHGDVPRVEELCDEFAAAYPDDYHTFCERTA